MTSFVKKSYLFHFTSRAQASRDGFVFEYAHLKEISWDTILLVVRLAHFSYGVCVSSHHISIDLGNCVYMIDIHNSPVCVIKIPFCFVWVNLDVINYYS